MNLLIVDIMLTALLASSIAFAMYVQYFSVLALKQFFLLSWLGVFFVVIMVLRFASYGKHFREYVQEARVEIAKVVWPEHSDVVRTTIAVGVAVVVFSIIMSIYDSLIIRFIAYLASITG